MAKQIRNEVNKISFGKKKRGKAKKSHNKHVPKPKIYVGQGR